MPLLHSLFYALSTCESIVEIRSTPLNRVMPVPGHLESIIVTHLNSIRILEHNALGIDTSISFHSVSIAMSVGEMNSFVLWLLVPNLCITAHCRQIFGTFFYLKRYKNPELASGSVF